MPLGLPAAGIVRTPDNFEAPIKAFVDNLETSAAAAVSTANAAATLAGQKYTKPSGGIPYSDLTAAPAPASASVGYQTWTGSAWSARPTGFLFVEAFSDGTAGSVSDIAAPAPTGAVNGDRWWKATA